MPFYHSLPIIGLHLRLYGRLDVFSPEEKKELYAKYRDDIGIGKETTFSADAFDKLVDSRIKDSTGFKDTKGPDGRTINEQLAAATTADEKKNAKDLKEKIKKALEPIKANPPTEGFTDAQNIYKESVATFRKLADKVPSSYSAVALIDTMIGLKDDAIKAINAQHEHEIRGFNTPEFKTQLAKTLNLTDKTEIDTAHTNMVKDLKSSHTKQLNEFEKSTQASVDALHKASASQSAELLFIANIRKNNVEMQQKIAELADKNRKELGLPPSNTVVTVGFSEDQISLSGIRVEDLGTITSITGKPISQQKTADGKTTFTLPLYSSLLPWGDLNYKKQYLKADMLLMAEAVKASGYDTITMNLDFENPKVANERARQAYEAARLAGFPPDKIVIKINGKEMVRDATKDEIKSELFKDYPHSLDKIEAKAKKMQEKNEELQKTPLPASTQKDFDKIREEMSSLRAKAKKDEAAKKLAEIPPNQPSPEKETIITAKM